ncbi:MAG: SAP domain-containing protein [Flavobacterium sp.]
MSTKRTDSLINEYLHCITTKCEQFMPKPKKTIKITEEKLAIPSIDAHAEFAHHNYNLPQLKAIAKHYQLKLTGNKPQLVSRIYSYLYLSSCIVRVQARFRGYLARSYTRLRGPAAMRRSLCTNAEDMVTMEPVMEIPFHQFFSYRDADGFVYGFDINSLHNLYTKSCGEFNNPYTRTKFPSEVFRHIRQLIRIGRILHHTIDIVFADDTKLVSGERAIEMRTVKLFQTIDELGHYSNSNWFLSLTRQQVIRFIRELVDIWTYRAQLPIETKCAICPPYGDPFRNVSGVYIHNEPDLWNIKKVVLEIMEKLVNSGTDKDSKALGAYYVLGSLTLVHPDAASSLPWLFQSFGYF